MAYLSKHKGADIDKLLDKINDYPEMPQMDEIINSLGEADINSLDVSASATSVKIQLTLKDGTVLSKTLPRCTATSAGTLSAEHFKEITGGLAIVKPGAPFLVEGMAVVSSASGLFLADSSAYPLGASGTLDASVTDEAQKAFYDRFMSKTPPCALIVPVIQTANENPYGAVTLPLVRSEFLSANSYSRFTYRSPYGKFANNFQLCHTVTVTVYHSQKGVEYTTSCPAWNDEYAALESELETLRLSSPLEIPAVMLYSGAPSPSASQRLSASSTGDAKRIYERVQQGWPPALLAAMRTTSTGDEVNVWLYPTQMTASSVRYESATLNNGSVSGKKMRIMLSKTSWQLFVD